MEFNATFLIATVSFLVFVFIMNQILYKPMAKIVKEREDYIKNNENSADASNKAAQELIDDKNEKTNAANQEAGKIILEKSNAAKDERTQLINNAQSNFKNMVEENKNNIRQEKAQVKEQMSGDTQDIANSIVAKFLGEGDVK